jgi:hypothetical protein
MTNPHILKLMNFLRDFADANADSFAPEQIDYLNQAAVAIVVLDEAVDKLVKERDDAYAQIDRYKNGYEGGCHACEVVAVRNQELLAERDENELLRSTITDCRIEIESIRAERDEARREVCEMLERDAGFAAHRQAESRGWDCFKERDDAQTNP